MEPPPVNVKSVIEDFNNEINKLISKAQLVKVNYAKGKKINSKMKDEIENINKRISTLRQNIEKQPNLGLKQISSLNIRLNKIQSILPNIKEIKKISSKSLKGKEKVEDKDLALPPLNRGPASREEKGFIGLLPRELTRELFFFILRSEPGNFIAKFKAAFPPYLINPQDAKRALDDIKSPSLEERGKGIPDNEILHAFFIDRLETLLKIDGGIDIIMQMIAGNDPIFSLSNIHRLTFYPSNKENYRNYLQGLQGEWDRYSSYFTTHSHIRMTLIGEVIKTAFEKGVPAEVRQYSLEKLVAMSRFEYRNNPITPLFDLNNTNEEILEIIKKEVGGAIQAGYARGNVAHLEVTDEFRCQLAFGQIEVSLNEIEKLIDQIHNTSKEKDRVPLMEKLKVENANLQQYLSNNWQKLGELCRQTPNRLRNFDLLETRLLSLGHYSI